MNEKMLKNLGDKIRCERVKRGLSQEQLAFMAGVNTRSLSTLENGLNNARFTTMKQVTKALNLNNRELINIYGDIEIMSDFDKTKNYVLELGYEIKQEIKDEEIIIIDDEKKGIKDLIIDCEDPIVVLEQFIFECKNPNMDVLQRLMQLNRELIHGAFVLDESAQKIIFRDTLRLATLDIEELQASIDSLSMAMAEYSNEIINFARENA